MIVKSVLRASLLEGSVGGDHMCLVPSSGKGLMGAHVY